MQSMRCACSKTQSLVGAKPRPSVWREQEDVETFYHSLSYLKLLARLMATRQRQTALWSLCHAKFCMASSASWYSNQTRRQPGAIQHEVPFIHTFHAPAPGHRTISSGTDCGELLGSQTCPVSSFYNGPLPWPSQAQVKLPRSVQGFGY